MRFLLNIGSYGLDSSSIDWGYLGIVALKVLMGFSILITLFIIFLILSAILIARSVKSGIENKSLNFALKKFLRGFFYVTAFFSVTLLLMIALPFSKNYPLYIVLIGAIGVSFLLTFTIISLIGVLIERVLLKLYVFKRISVLLHKLLLLIDSYIAKR
jgi:hypothetical protein